MVYRSMNTWSCLNDLSDQQLLAEVRTLAWRERETTANLIASLMEMDARRLYLGEGCSLAIQAFEITNQQQAEVAARRKPWPTLVGVESLTRSFHVWIEAVLVEDLIQARVERMRGTARQILRGHPHRRLVRAPLSFAHCHRRQCRTRDRSCRSLIQGFTPQNAHEHHCPNY